MSSNNNIPFELKNPNQNDNKIDYDDIETNMGLQIDIINEITNQKIKSENDKNKTTNNMKIDDASIIKLNNQIFDKNSSLKKLNEPKKEDNKVIEKKKGFFQSSKEWINKTWNNIKNYDYSKLNIFKGEEMEECLDAHGFPIKIPKRRNNQESNNIDGKYY